MGLNYSSKNAEHQIAVNRVGDKKTKQNNNHPNG